MWPGHSGVIRQIRLSVHGFLLRSERQLDEETRFKVPLN
jgi:hypothetical protein